MKKLMMLVVIFALFLLSSCTSPDISKSLDLSMKVSKTKDIDFGDKVTIDYSITSTLEQPLTKEEYSLQISQARPGETSRTIISDVSKTIPVRGSNSGTFVWNIDGIPGSGGDFDLYLTFYKKVDSTGSIVIKETSQRVSFIVPELTK